MKKLIAVLLVLVCALSLFSCKRGADQAPMGEITETSNADTPFWNYADDAVLNELNATFDAKKAETQKFASVPTATGTTYYVSSVNGSISGNGTSPETAWKNCYQIKGLKAGDAVLFECGSEFRERVQLVSGVTYASYGEGEKPVFYGSINASQKNLWREVSGVSNLYQYNGTISASDDIGSIVFNGGEAWGIKIQEIYKWVDGKISWTENKSLALTNASNGLKTFDKIPSFTLSDGKDLGKYGKIDLAYFQDGTKLYLYCEGGNPAERFSSIELSSHVRVFYGNNISNTTIANINFFGGSFAIRTQVCDNLVVKNCGFEFIGGHVQADYENSARNYQTRLGNAIENWNECKGMTVENCYFNQIYDTAMTTQSNTDGTDMVNIVYRNNVMENMVYAIELWSSGGNNQTCNFTNVTIEGNVCRDLGVGMTSQRPDKVTAFLSAYGSNYIYENAKMVNNIVVGSTEWLLRSNNISTKTNPNGYVMDGNIYVSALGNDLGMLSASFPKYTTSIKEYAYNYNTVKQLYDEGVETNGKFYYTSDNKSRDLLDGETFNSYILGAPSYSYTLEGGATLPFRLIFPKNYDETKSYKLLTYLNYEYANGTDNLKNVQLGNEFLADAYANSEYILLVPQCPEDTWTGLKIENGNYSVNDTAESAVMRSVYGLIHDIALKYQTAGNYAVGVSAGGYAVADLCARHENLLTAAVILAGAGDPAATIGNTKVLIYHGEGDEKIAVSNAQALSSAWGAEYKELTRELHDCWKTAFAKEDILGWLNMK